MKGSSGGALLGSQCQKGCEIVTSTSVTVIKQLLNFEYLHLSYGTDPKKSLSNQDFFVINQH